MPPPNYEIKNCDFYFGFITAIIREASIINLFKIILCGHKSHDTAKISNCHVLFI